MLFLAHPSHAKEALLTGLAPCVMCSGAARRVKRRSMENGGAPLGSCHTRCRELHCHTDKRREMAANELVQARIDGGIKREAAAVLATIGLTVSDAVRLMLTRVAREHALPFDPLIPNESTIAAMKDARSGKLEAVTLDQLQTVLDADD
jgi:DNA-damage-inducible protein J